MNLSELFRNPKLVLSEGGNVSSQSPGWQGVPGEHQAQELDLHVHNRSYVQDVVSKLLHTINDVFAQQHQEPLWHENSVKTQKFLSGSTLQFMDKKISDEEFIRVKPKVGDIDTQASDKHGETIKQFLQTNTGKMFGDAVLLGFTPGNSQWVSLWEIKLKDLPVKIQIDFEYGAHETDTGLPTEWQSYSHSSSWDDLSQNIKGVFHKYLDRALPYAQASTKYVARVLKKSTKISPEPVTDSDYSFAVSGPGGGGISQKYIPYVDPATGQPMIKDGIPVMQLLEPSARQYIQNLSQQFEIFFGRKPKGNDQQLKNSFVGTVQLIAKYLDEQKKEEIARRFFSICFEPGSQMITKDDPVRDRDIKFAAIDWMLENMKLANAAGLRKQAIEMATSYAAAFQNKAAKPLKEAAEVKAQLRKGMPHLHDLKPADLLDLLDEIHDGNGNFKLQNIPLNVKVDGFGGRFGKNSEGRPFMGTSRTEPRYEPGFVAYHQKKGTTDPEVLGRAQLFDELFEEMMKAVKLVDSKLGPGFLVNKQVTCEVLYLPFATETPEGKLKFVGIHYDKLPKGVKLALVPFRVTDATTGDDLPNSNKIVQELTSVGQSGSVMFIDNSLTQNEALDVTALVPPVENIDELKAMLASNKLEARRQVKAALEPVAAALERAIINDPNIIGKDMLGKDYEGIVINSRLGPIKVTSQEQRDVITAKNAAKVNARTERPRGEAKTAVVAIGSFIGHRGHEELFDYTIKKAQAVGGDPYLFIGNAEGKDDPIPPAVKVQTWHKLYPEYAKNISTVQEGGALIQKVKHELINPLPGKPPRYDNIIIMVGEDRAGMNMPNALMKAVNKFQGYEHVKVSLDVTPRGTGISGTMLRNSLKNDSPDQALATWSKAFDVNKLGVDWIKHLMDITRKGMGIQEPKAPVPQPEPAPVAEQRVLNALVNGPMKHMAKDLTGKGAPIARAAAQRDKKREQQSAQSHGRAEGPKWDVEEGFSLPTIEGIKNWLLKLKQGLSQEAGESKEMLNVYARYAQGFPVDKEEMAVANEQLKDVARGIGMGIFAAIPGHVITVPILFGLAKKYNIQLLPSAFNKPKQGVAEGSRDQVDPNTVWEVCFDYGPHQSDKVKVRASSQEEAEQKGMRAAKKLGHRFPQLNWAMPVEQGVAEGSEESAEKYKAHLIKTAPRVMDFLDKSVKGWRPSEQEMMGAIDTAYMVMKHTGDVKQAGKAMMDELNTLHRMSQGQQGVVEGSSYNIDQDDHDEFTPDEIVRIKNSHFPDTLRDNLRAAKKEARRAKHFSSSSDGGETNLGSPVGSASDNTYEGVAEGKRSDTYHIVNKDGKPASLASYADKESAVKDRDAKHQGAEVRQLGPRGKVKSVAEGSLNEFAPDGFGGDDGEGFDPEIAKMAQEDGFTKGVSLVDGATLERAMTINHWHSQHGGMYKQYFAKGFKQGRMNKINHDNKQYNLNLKLMKDGSIRHGEQGVAEGTNDTVYPNAEVIKSKNGKPVGEIYQDGNSWGCFHYKADRGYDFIDSREEAIEALKDLHQETGRSRPDYTIKGVAEARMSAAQRLWNAEQKQRAKSNASLARTPSSIPKPEPKKDEKTNEEGGVGVIATKKQAKDPRYSMSLTKDVRPGQVEKNLKAFDLAEKMMPASMFAGSKKNKLGPAGQWKNTGPKKNKPAQAGDLVGGDSIQHRGVPISEDVENIMDALINKIIVNEAISNNQR